MKVFSGRSNIKLAKGICGSLGIPLGEVTIKDFSDGEMYVAFNENIRNEDVFIIQSTNSPSSNLLEMLLMLDAAKRASARTVVAVMPYFGYARQDRKDKPRVPISSRLILDLICAAGVDRIITMDLHSPQIQGFVNIPFDHLYSRIALLDHVKKMELDEQDGVVLSPDIGSAPMSQSYAKKLGIGFALILIVMPINVYAIWIFGLLRNLHEIHIHSDLELPFFSNVPFLSKTKHHDDHHSKLAGNYASTFNWMDRIFKTTFKK